MTYSQATAKLPDHARWSCSFGNPGEGGYVEIYRDASGNRYVLANGTWDGNGKVWTFELLAAQNETA
jgi:hypothetical protein